MASSYSFEADMHKKMHENMILTWKSCYHRKIIIFLLGRALLLNYLPCQIVLCTSIYYYMSFRIMSPTSYKFYVQYTWHIYKLVQNEIIRHVNILQKGLNQCKIKVINRLFNWLKVKNRNWICISYFHGYSFEFTILIKW